MNMNQEMLDLTRAMVKIASINGTQGEREIGKFIEATLRAIPYFEKYPEQVIVQELKQDLLHRANVFAILRGEKDNNSKTILLHGHTDTVGLEGYGALGQDACNPERLQSKMQNMKLPQEVRADLESGEYLFGRGACDMKSGDAVFLGMIKNLSAHPEMLSGNIVVSFNPVEETLHQGIIEGLEILEQLQNQYHLQYILAINNDFICPLYPGDSMKTIYTGTVGKLLPCFYIRGKETHVGQCFEGLDASMLAAELVDKINLNHDFSDEYQGEYSYPPSVLKIKDLKPWYNVQTAAEAFVYFNYFVHNASIKEITEKLMQAANLTFEKTIARINEENRWFCEKTGQKQHQYSYDYRVLTYAQLYQEAAAQSDFSEAKLTERFKYQQAKNADKREIPIEMIRYLLCAAKITVPAIILYYATPYCPHNTLQGDDEHFVEEIQNIAAQVTAETGDTYRMMKFFPSLSDSSYLKIDDSPQSIQMLVDNFPGMQELYPVPLNQIRRLNIPAINYGCYGKDAHKWTERVHIPYTFGVLPLLIEKTIAFYL